MYILFLVLRIIVLPFIKSDIFSSKLSDPFAGLSARKFSSSKGRMTVANPGRQSLPQAEIIMLGDTRSPEAGACGRVIQLLLRGQLQDARSSVCAFKRVSLKILFII